MAEDVAVLLDLVGPVATLTLNRPERLNAFDAALHAALDQALERVEGEPSVRALIITGAGRGFCAGQDLQERAAAFARGETPDLEASLRLNYNPLIRRLTSLPLPVIAAVNGVASGAGLSLALACDVVIASDDARFQLAFANVGLGPDAGASWLLPRAIGLGAALPLALLGEAIDATEALRLGLVFEVVVGRALNARAATIARTLAARPPQALAAIKRRLRAGASESLDTALEAERGMQAILSRHPHYREAVLAFAAKRIPHFA